MDTNILKETLVKLLARDKGILAADESNGSAGKRLAAVGVDNTEENRRLYRQLFLDTPSIENYLSGVILYDETMRQQDDQGVLFPQVLAAKGILPGIKVDTGTVDFNGFPNETVTEGLDHLDERLGAYFTMGARFAKWRAVIKISDQTPTEQAIVANGFILARYAALCLANNIIPIIEPEVLLKGRHDIDRAESVTTQTLETIFEQLDWYQVNLKYVVLKTSMVVPGDESGQSMHAEQVGQATVRCLRNSVPDEVPGVVFLSGGQSPEQATANFAAIARHEPLPWELAFSFARAIQGPALEVWRGKSENVDAARQVFLDTLVKNSAADRGEG